MHSERAFNGTYNELISAHRFRRRPLPPFPRLFCSRKPSLTFCSSRTTSSREVDSSTSRRVRSRRRLGGGTSRSVHGSSGTRRVTVASTRAASAATTRSSTLVRPLWTPRRARRLATRRQVGACAFGRTWCLSTLSWRTSFLACLRTLADRLVLARSDLT